MKPLRDTPNGDAAVRYRNAAHYLEKQYDRGHSWGACWAISLDCGDPVPYMDRFKDALAPEGASFGEFWWHLDDEGMNERILGLCFMAAMVEAGDA